MKKIVYAMLQINMTEVINILNSIKSYLIGKGIVFALVITANLICFIPMSTMISLATETVTITFDAEDMASPSRLRLFIHQDVF